MCYPLGCEAPGLPRNRKFETVRGLRYEKQCGISILKGLVDEMKGKKYEVQNNVELAVMVRAQGKFVTFPVTPL